MCTSLNPVHTSTCCSSLFPVHTSRFCTSLNPVQQQDDVLYREHCSLNNKSTCVPTGSLYTRHLAVQHFSTCIHVVLNLEFPEQHVDVCTGFPVHTSPCCSSLFHVHTSNLVVPCTHVALTSLFPVHTSPCCSSSSLNTRRLDVPHCSMYTRRLEQFLVVPCTHVEVPHCSLYTRRRVYLIVPCTTSSCCSSLSPVHTTCCTSGSLYTMRNNKTVVHTGTMRNNKTTCSSLFQRGTTRRRVHTSRLAGNNEEQCSSLFPMYTRRLVFLNCSSTHVALYSSSMFPVHTSSCVTHCSLYTCRLVVPHCSLYTRRLEDCSLNTVVLLFLIVPRRVYREHRGTTR